MRASLICEKCKKETLSFEGMDNSLYGTLVIDFYNQYIQFVCPECGHINEMDMGNIQKSLDKRTKLPPIGRSNF